MNQNITSTVDAINDFVKKQMWMDFEFNQYNGYELLIGGTIDLSAPDYMITIIFRNVNFICLGADWTANTEKDIFKLLDGEEWEVVRQKYQIQSEYSIFQFFAGDSDAPLYVAAKEITYDTDSKAISAPRK